MSESQYNPKPWHFSYAHVPVTLLTAKTAATTIVYTCSRDTEMDGSGRLGGAFRPTLDVTVEKADSSGMMLLLLAMMRPSSAATVPNGSAAAPTAGVSMRARPLLRRMYWESSTRRFRTLNSIFSLML